MGNMDDPSPKPVTARWLMNAAQFYLARHAASEAHLSSVLKRKAEKRAAARPDEAALALIAGTIEALRKAGLLDDRAFAAARTRTLQRKGLSAGRARANLATKGVDRALAAKAIAEAGFDEAAQVLTTARRLRLAAFAEADVPLTEKEIAKLARRGFSLEAIRAGLRAAREAENS
jgi:regulatory protein